MKRKGERINFKRLWMSVESKPSYGLFVFKVRKFSEGKRESKEILCKEHQTESVVKGTGQYKLKGI
jgi:hypothetical protein